MNQKVILEILENNWTITIFGAIIAAIILRFVFKPKNKKGKVEQKPKTTINNIINIHDLINKNRGASSNKALVPNEVSFYKENIRILFIDDLDISEKTGNLMRAGWRHVGQITSADDIDQQAIKEADIIFIDYLGVAMSSEDQGVALVSALRERYKDTKWLILFSAHNLPIKAYNNNKRADSYLDKNASIYEIEQKILEGLEALHK
jgi:ActR/RegA family two-component response regulator